MSNRYVVKYKGRAIASIHASTAQEACERACAIITNAPHPRDCEAYRVN